jgi:hypothetical protein
MTTTESTSVSRGFVRGVENGRVLFNPAGTNYSHHLETASAYTGPMDKPVKAIIRCKARKIYSMPSGGNWIQPILGTPRIIQGRVTDLTATHVTVQAGASFVVELPTGKDTVDLHTGSIEVGSMVNVVAWPGASLELV